MSIWEHNTLGELCTLEIGGTPTRNNPLYWDSENTGSNYWVSIADLKTPEIMETEERITDLGVRHSNAKLFKKGTVLLSFKLTVGRVAIAGRDLYTNEAIAGLTSEKLDHHFLYYGLQHWNLLKDVDQAIKGITLNKRKLKKIDAHYPPDKKEQSKIAEILATIDRAIAQTEALIAKHQRIKTGLMQDLLTRGIDEHGQLRDPSTHRFKSTPLGMIPEDWEVSTLEQKCERVTDGAHASFPKNEGEIPFLFVSCIRNGQIYWDQASTISEQVYEIISKGKEPKKGLVLYTIVGSYGFVAVVEDDRRFSFQRHIGYLLPKVTELSPHFLATWLNSEYGKRFADLFAMGNAQKTIILRDLKLFPLPVPSLPEQERINEILKKTDLEIDNLKKQQIKYEAMKMGLMQDLLSGRVSVKGLMEE